MKHSLLIALMLFFVTGSEFARAQNKVVVVPLFDTSPTGVAAIPVYCSRTAVSPSGSPITTRLISCFRADTRATVMPVPAGHFFFMTDVTVTNNTVPFTSGASVVVGRDTGSTFPGSPSVRIDAVFPKGNHIKYATPYVILRQGERLRVAHNANVSGMTSVTVNTYVSGYLVKADGFGN
jgi:hypothetical protein